MPSAPRVAVSQLEDEVECVRGQRAATTPVGGAAPSSPSHIPYSQVLAARKAELQAKTKAQRQQQQVARSVHGWSDTTSGDETGRSSANTSIGNKSDTKLTPKQLLRKYKARIKPRTWLYIIFVFVEAIMVLAFFLSAHASHHAVVVTYENSAKDMLSSVHEGYTKKVYQTRNLLEGTQYNFDVQTYLAAGGQTAANETRIVALMQNIQKTYQVEFAMLLDQNKAVLYDVNRNNSRQGETVDPEGLVTLVQQQQGDTLWTYGLLKYEDFVAEGCPVFRDRESELDQAFKGAHPTETQADSLIRWVSTGILRVDRTTLEPIDANEAPAGYLVIGDIVNGKSSSTSLIGLTLGGMAGVYHRRNSSNALLDELGGHRWLTASVTANALLEAATRTAHTIQNVLVQGFSPYDALRDKDGDFDSVQGRPETDMTATLNQISPYQLAIREWHTDDEQEPVSGKPPLVLARGLIIDDALTSKFMLKQQIRLAVIIATDLLTLFLATWLFLAPLEAMGKRIRAGQRVDIAFLKSLTKRRKLGIVIAAVAVFSVVVGVDMRMSCARNMDRLVDARSAVEPGCTMLAYRQGMDQASRVLTTMQTGSGLIKLLADPTDQVHYDFAHVRLAKLEDTLNVEMAFMYDTNAALLVAPHNRDVLGEAYDPSSIVADTLNTSLSYKRTSLIPASDLLRFSVVRKDDRYFNETPQSALYPVCTGAETLIRWSSVPLWEDGLDHATARPSGVLVTGDIVNGKTRIVERANRMVTRGYSAVYFYNSRGKYQLAAGLMRISGTEFEVDVQMPETAWLDRLRKSQDWRVDDHATVTTTMHFNGDGAGKYVVSARCLNKNVVMESYGADVDPRDWHGEPLGDCLGYLIQGLPWSVQKDILAPCYSAQWAFVSMCIIKFFAMGILCWLAYRPFNRIIVTNKFVQGGDHAALPAVDNGRPKNASSSKGAPRGNASTTVTASQFDS